MDWLASLDGRAGPLRSAAERFLRAHPGAPPSPLRAGPEGLRRLAEAIDAWAEQDEDAVSSRADEDFLEGSGALLGALLLEHLGGAHVARDGAHRVRLGPFGFFDPFAAVTRALEAEVGARETLAIDVAQAEAEAAGAAGVGRALRLFVERLAEARPDRRVRDFFGGELTLDDGVEVDLARAIRATEGESEAAARAAVDKIVRMLPGGDSVGLSFDEAAARLVPRVVPPGFAAGLATGFTDGVADGRGSLAARALLGGALEVTLVLAYDDRSRYVRLDELTRWERTFDDALTVATANLAARSDGARFARVDTEHGPLVVARTGDGLDAARILLPSLPDVLGGELGLPFVAAVPHRDALFACADEPALCAALKERVRQDAARAPHRISDALFEVHADGLRAR